MNFINIDPFFKKAFRDDNYRFDIFEQISLTDKKAINELFGKSLIYIFHGKNSEILNICRSSQLRRKDFYNKVNGVWTKSIKPISVSGIVLNKRSVGFAKKLKNKLIQWLKPIN